MEQEKKNSSFSEQNIEELDKQIKELLPSLPKKLFEGKSELALYQGFWCPTVFFGGAISFQRCFQAQDTDIIVASNPKCGSTWLKALTFSVVNRTRYTPSNTPLLTSNPHALVPYIDFYDLRNENQVLDLTNTPSPRLYATHFPFSALPKSIKESKCRIIYVSRNPFDSAVSLWYHILEMGSKKDHEMPTEDYFDVFFEGISWYGPYWDNVLGYWEESLKKSDKVLFLKYEDMKEDMGPCLKRIGEFIGCPFSEEEERDGVIREIEKLCSFSSLKNLEVNKKGKQLETPNKVNFRKGEVGNWIHYLSPSKKQHLVNVMQQKLRGSGLSFKLSI